MEPYDIGLRVTDEPLTEILAYLTRELTGGARAELAIRDPAATAGAYAGEQGHRPWRVWTELADALAMRLAIRADGDGFVLTFTALDRERTLERGEGVEAYGVDSGFARIHKLEDPSFVIDLRDALARAHLPPTASVLDVGSNRGDELELIYEAAPDARVTALDHSQSTLAIGRARWPRATFELADVTQPLEVGRFDLVIAIGMMQTGNLDDRALLRRLVQDHLAPTGSVILGVPNCRYFDGEVSYGARMRNFAQPELGLVVKDIAFYRKYLQQHHRQVFVTGRNYLFVTAVGG
ncbi:MAG: class I SAM-dependent methyltransferase [Kofleriaceae bacterium]